MIPFRGFESHPRRVHHRIRSRVPLGGLFLTVALIILGLVGFVVSEASGVGGWLVAGAVICGVGVLALVVMMIGWWRASLTLVTTDTGFTATASGGRVTTRWDEISAVTATDDELRVRRSSGQALVLRLPSGADRSAVAALTDDMVAKLNQRRGPITPKAQKD